MSNFEVGDVVVNLNDINLWNNTYHSNRFVSLMRETVTSVSGDLFTTAKSISFDDDFSDKSMVAQRVFRQSDGRCIADASSFRYNLTKDKDVIMQRFSEYFDAAIVKLDSDDQEAIDEIEDEIHSLQAKLEAIKAGNRPLTKNQTYREHHEACKKAVLDKLII